MVLERPISSVIMVFVERFMTVATVTGGLVIYVPILEDRPVRNGPTMMEERVVGGFQNSEGRH